MEITIKVTKPQRTLILREHIGKGNYQGNAFRFDLSLPDRSFIINIDGKTYVVDAKSIIQAVINKHIETQNEKAEKDHGKNTAD